jgi:hypothetical protein
MCEGFRVVKVVWEGPDGGAGYVLEKDVFLFGSRFLAFHV